MNCNKYLANRLREVYLDGKWIANTNYKEQLQNLNWEQATIKIADLNSIAALTFHINYYLVGLIKVLNGKVLDISDKFSFNLNELKSESDWKELKNDLLNNAELFASMVENLPEEKLKTTFIEEKYGTYLRNIEAVIEHSYYHLGQISLIKKMIIQQ